MHDNGEFILVLFIQFSRHVTRVADQKEDDLEKLYEKRNKKLSLQKPAEDTHLEIDPVDALPVKTLDGQLYYRAGILIIHLQSLS